MRAACQVSAACHYDTCTSAWCAQYAIKVTTAFGNELMSSYVCVAAGGLAGFGVGNLNLARSWYDIESVYPRIPRSRLRARFESLSRRTLGDFLFFDDEDM